MTIVSGIDFGTSNSSVSYMTEDQACRLVTLEENSAIMPTALFFDGESNTVTYGNAAVRAFTQGEHGRFMRSMKRILGSPLMHSGTQVNGRHMKFTDIMAAFIRHLKNSLEKEAGQNVDSVIMGRPVRFRDGSVSEDRRAEEQLREVTAKAGFKNIAFQFEPIAAAFAHERKVASETLACVVDIGGGTSDFTIIRIGKALRKKTDRSSDILANTGVRIGGNDFDRLLSIQGVMPALGRGTTHGSDNLRVPPFIYTQLSEWSEINLAYTPRTLNIVKSVLRDAHEPEQYSRLLALIEQERAHDLLRIVEQAKIDLTEHEKTTATLHCVRDQPSVTIAREEFNEYIAGQADKIAAAIHECLSQAGLPAEKVELVILTGGSTEIPLIKRTTRAMLPSADISEGNKLSSVGEGLAYDSYRRFVAAC